MNDKQKRDAAVDAFAAAIKARLDEQAAKGYTGWDGTYEQHKLEAELMNDVISVCARSKNQRKLVDIGARAMMLHFRSTCETRDPLPVKEVHPTCPFLGTAHYDEMVLVEVWEDVGDYGHVRYVLLGYRYVPSSRLRHERSNPDCFLRGCLPLCMRLAYGYKEEFEAIEKARKETA